MHWFYRCIIEISGNADTAHQNLAQMGGKSVDNVHIMDYTDLHLITQIRDLTLPSPHRRGVDTFFSFEEKIEMRSGR